MSLIISEDIKSVSELKKKTNEIFRQMHHTGRPIIVTVNGKPDAVLLDVEVFDFKVLEETYKNAQEDHEKEHVTSYIYGNAKRFKIVQVGAPKELYAPDIRITLDTEEDYALLCAVFEFLYPKNHFFGVKDIISLFTEKPWLR